MDSKKKVAILRTVLIVAIVGIAVSLCGFIYTLNEYSKSKKVYDGLEQYVSDMTQDEEIDVNQEDSQEELQAPVESMIKVNPQIDFEALSAINPDMVGWIYYEPLELSYPVVIDKGNDYYEDYSFDLEKNVSGAIFLDYACRSDFDGFNSIIYGHNMRDGSMFGSLKQLLKDTSIIETDPYFYVFTKDYAFMYKIVCAYYASAKSKTYDLLMDYTLDDKKDYVDYIGTQAEYKDDEFFSKEITDELKLATLSTCHGLHSSNRTVIHGELIAKEKRQ